MATKKKDPTANMEVVKARARTLAKNGVEKGKQLAAKAKDRAKKKDEQTRGMVIVGAVGQHLTAVVVGQLNYKYAAEKPALVKIGSYGIGIGGAALAMTSDSYAMRTTGVAMMGASVAQAAIDSSKTDMLGDLWGGE